MVEFDRELIILYQNVTQNRQQYSTNLNILLSFIKPWFTQPLDCHPQLLSHWIHLLKHNIQDEENMAILNHLCNGSYLKNYGADIPVQLESVIGGFSSGAIKKLILRRPWIGYFLAITWCKFKKYKPKETLMFFRELAVELRNDALSLLFWEYFWMIYFDSLITLQVDPLSQDIKNDIYQSIYTSKGPMLPPIRRVYETFTTWNKESILPNNGRIVSVENQELWKLFSNSALWIFNKNEDKVFYETNQRNWLNSLSQDINSHLLVNQLLIPKRDAESFNAEEKKYQNFEDIFNEAAQSILKSTVVESIKLFNDLKLYLGHSKRLSQNILHDDKVFSELSQSLHNTKLTRNNAILKCSNPSCLGVTVSVETKSSQPNAQSSSMIKDNRKSFNEHFYNLFERVYQLAVLTLVLEDRRLHDLYFQKEDLFALLVQISSDHSDSITETVINTLSEVAYRIGKDILDKDPSNQTFLLNTFLPQGIASDNAPKTDYSLFVRLFSPSLVNDMTKYLDYLELSITSPRISNQQKRDIFESFKIDTKIQQITHMPGGKERLFQLLPTMLETNAIEPTAIIINALLFVDSSYLINVTLALVKDFASLELMERVYGKSRQFYEFVKSIKPEQQNLIIQTLVEKISDLVPRSINMAWEVFFYGYIPLLDKYRKTDEAKKNRHIQELVELMGNMVAEGHLETATFHVQPNDILEQMCNVICQTEYGEIVVALFSILDWGLLRSIAKIPDHVGLHYLKLCMYISILNGSSIAAPDLGLALGGDNSIDWYKCGDLQDATVIFDGLALTNVITSLPGAESHAATHPFARREQGGQRPRAIGNTTENEEYPQDCHVLLGLRSEIETDHLHALEGSQHQSSKLDIELLFDTLTESLSTDHAGHAYRTERQSLLSGDRGSATLAALGRHHPSIDTDQQVLGIHRCRLCHSQIHPKQLSGHSLHCDSPATTTKDSGSSSYPRSHHQHLIPKQSTNDINLKDKATLQKINIVKSWIQSFFGNTNPITSLFSKNKTVIPQTHLASRACYIFLIRSIIQQQGKSKDDEQLLNSTVEGLLELKKKSKDYQTYDAFFNQVDNFLSPIVEVDDFSQILIQTLVPFASYLSNLLKYEP
ncbi:hypothetical protein PPL_10188 [Heterostelium album PN500]|uniref:Uncharacterized protein n=1 Tax=Heterostelium pallidum (strain ATCC 26659 / Pp 5 / PN500) TaxID=670386 RepID=D3BQK3_HETP5|nr:hypothetical protein PPL_10188 [Heterostelium album PN500]EFA76423.1 hypothetical protein PPL_10188 [Heterostelium album PN500]|eukprot:XP_020428555.1 hypothetical protein PPL_10188 [Heterostelium album PN500]